MNVAIYGGSFDPPHIGHEKVVIFAQKMLEIDKVIVLPNFLNPWKSNFKIAPEDRFKLLTKLFENNENVEISRFEIDNGRPTLTIESVRHFSEIYENINLIIGADNVNSIQKWDEFEEIDSLVNWVVATRNGIRVPNGFKLLNVDEVVSSTEIRNGKNIEMIPEKIRSDVLNLLK
ncbi:nicotinate/nicotinamide nucleotide adenylyltransferase [Thiovulum sp. ES]|nr:nicotinate/nicotinamide nucleotide adenylyltransferase [Thiovulum sp. ES]